ncbi:MAG: type III pantothenate kinase [Ruminococcaceae bacterium]|nr:type III pantothenate kinase [Oscillospiraceae bacterium]
MLLAVDIGNSSITVGVFHEEGRLLSENRLQTVVGKSADEYAILLQGLFSLYGIDRGALTESIVSSVVPSLTHAVCAAVEQLLGAPPKVVGPGIKTGLNIRIDAQAQLGADLVANAVGALECCQPPMVIADLGTATTLTVIGKSGALEGVVIAPGVRLSLNALSNHGAELPDSDVASPKRLIAKNTGDSMRAGVVIGHAAMLEGLLERIEEELGSPVTVPITGGLAEAVLPHCRRAYLHRPHLTLEGLCAIARKNRK